MVITALAVVGHRSYATPLSQNGNPAGNFAVPAAGAAVDTSKPTHVIGNGTPASCTSSAVVTAVAQGGIITFNCGAAPVTIQMTATAVVANTEQQVVIDGGGLVTLSGGGLNRILMSDTCAGPTTSGHCSNQQYPQITVQNITFANGFNGTQQTACTTNTAACWFGGVNGGGAIYVEGGQFSAVNSAFVNNKCYAYGPDLGGGAIRVVAQYQNLPVYINRDTFSGNQCSNGGALSSISVNWDVLNSTFSYNAAIGWGKNPADAGTPGGGLGGAIYNDGAGYNTLIAGTTMTNNSAREGAGAIFYVLDQGAGTLTINSSQLKTNPNGTFGNAPGIFDEVDLKDVLPTMINSTNS